MSAFAPRFRPGTEEVRLSREMSGFSVMMIGVGAMIGAGIFVLTGIAAGVAGPGLLLAFGLNGIVTLFTAMAYAELGSCFHDAGGGYLWVKSSLPHPNGFLSGWMSWFAHAVACSLYALGSRFLVIKLLNSIGWEKLSKKNPALRILEVGDIRYPFFELIGAIVFWVVILVFTGTAAHSLGLTSVELLIDRFVSFLPNLFLAFVMLGLGAWLGRLAGRFARAFAHAAGIPEANLLGKGIQYLVIIVALGTALEQLNVATRFLFGTFLIVLGALGLAFGLGGQEKAREIIRRISGVEEKEGP